MDSKERKQEVREEVRQDIRDASDEAHAAHNIRHNRSTRKINKLWLWLGVLILCILLVWWLFSLGTAEDLSGAINGN